MPDDSLGVMSTCHRCGGKNALTGRERLKPPEGGFGSGPKYRIREAEFACKSCGALVWSPTGAEDEPNEPA